MPLVNVFTVDSFTARPFEGNPAAVVPLPSPLTESEMQRIASEMNLSETVFTWPAEVTESPISTSAAGTACYAIRWFTPLKEVMLCGHATLAAAHVLHTEDLGAGRGDRPTRLRFLNPMSGPLEVEVPAPACSAPIYALDFPNRVPDRTVLDVLRAGGCFDALCGGLGVAPDAVEDVLLHEASRKYLVVLRGAAEVTSLTPNVALLQSSFAPSRTPLSVTVTAAVGGADGPWSQPTDVVSRHFAPWVGIPEDPVTGAAHIVLGPYWAGVLGVDRLRCYQAFPGRGGHVAVEVATDGTRVTLRGEAVTILRGTLSLP